MKKRAILHLIAQSELMQGAETECNMPGLWKTWAKKLSRPEQELVLEYRKLRSDLAEDFAKRLEASPVLKAG